MSTPPSDVVPRMLTEPEMRNAVSTRDRRYDGLFVFGVITTGIFCRPSCPSRSARPEHLRFYINYAAAQRAGFRACKRCDPRAQHLPQSQVIGAIAEYIHAKAADPLSLAHLAAQVQLSPAHFQRQFKSVIGLSPKMFQHFRRLQLFKLYLRSAKPVQVAASRAGLHSASQLSRMVTGYLGMTPRAYRSGGTGQRIHYLFVTKLEFHLLLGIARRGLCFAEAGNAQALLLHKLAVEFPHAERLPLDCRNPFGLNAIAATDRLKQALTCLHLDELPEAVRAAAFQGVAHRAFGFGASVSKVL
jgi:AraC family transcriptional regulator, regulatory protein of adaptative response / methylated-DNA-[protein]-cysteine methyltransferase